MTLNAPTRTTSRWLNSPEGVATSAENLAMEPCSFTSRSNSYQTRSISSTLGSLSEPLILAISSFRKTSRSGNWEETRDTSIWEARSPVAAVRWPNSSDRVPRRSFNCSCFAAISSSLSSNCFSRRAERRSSLVRSCSARRSSAAWLALSWAKRCSRAAFSREAVARPSFTNPNSCSRFSAATSCGVGPAGTAGASPSSCAYTPAVANAPAKSRADALKNWEVILVGLRRRYRHIQEFDGGLLLGDAHPFADCGRVITR